MQKAIYSSGPKIAPIKVIPYSVPHSEKTWVIWYKCVIFCVQKEAHLGMQQLSVYSRNYEVVCTCNLLLRIYCTLTERLSWLVK